MACSRPDLIQFVAVGLDMPSMAQASSNVRLYDSIGYLQAIKNPAGARSLIIFVVSYYFRVSTVTNTG